jgi:hypothetical protein
MKKCLLVLVAFLCFAVSFTGNVYSQAQKKVLLENWTSSTCGPCASNNPQLRQWIADHWTNLTCVAYHVGWPSPGNDPMYLHNPTEVTARVNYYGITGVPAGWMLGTHSYLGSPFPFGNMSVYYDMYSAQTVASGLTVTDTRFGADSNNAQIVVTNYTALTGVNYLRVFVTEHWIIYASPPGSNGETIFENVFRKALPPTQGPQGTLLSNAAGTYVFNFKYRIDPVWKDSSIHTMAFIQNDINKVVMNTARHGMVFTGVTPDMNEIPNKFSLMQNYPNPFNPTTNIKFDLPKDQFVTLKIYDILGNEVQTLVEGNHKAGKYNIMVDGTNLSSGIYFYTLKSNSFVETKKMTLLK